MFAAESVDASENARTASAVRMTDVRLHAARRLRVPYARNASTGCMRDAVIDG